MSSWHLYASMSIIDSKVLPYIFSIADYVISSWLESGFVNLTYTVDEIDCDIGKIKALLDEIDTSGDVKRKTKGGQFELASFC